MTKCIKVVVNINYPLVTVANTYYYDQVGRKLLSWEQITNGNSSPTAKTLISKVSYNEIGQLKYKRLHSTDSVNYMQVISYTYNERGWLSTTGAPLFAEVFDYNTNTNKQYNGNIAYQYWGVPGNLNNHYTYIYDKLNRLTSGITSLDNYQESGITYDVMGNISTLNRYQAGTEIDQLSYSYTVSSNPTNQLQSVTDATSSNYGIISGTTNYTYDGNGNLKRSTNTADTVQNKGFAYNLLNLPQAASFLNGTSTYSYDATGNKLRKVDVISGITTATDYISGIQYGTTGGTTSLSFIQTEEGKAVSLTSGGYDFTYYLGDNLGNTRITFDTQTGSAVSQQQDDYYPFGLEINRSTTSPKNEYLYNKKELQEELGQYDYGARFYDPVIARWTSPDLLAEVAPSLTPYRYCYNNPISFTDPYGLWETDKNGNQTTNKKEDIERFMSYLDAESAMNVKPSFSQVSTFVSEEKAGGLGKLTDGSKLLNPINIQQYNTIDGGHGYKVDQKSFSDFWHQVQKDFNPYALDTRTWHQNILGLSYAGANNPKNYLGQDDYSRPPDQIEDIPAYQHDLNYNAIHAVGGNSLFNDPRTQPANAKLIKAEIKISLIPGLSPATKARAIIIAIGIGGADTYNVMKNEPPPQEYKDFSPMDP